MSPLRFLAHTPVLGLIRGTGRHRPARPAHDRQPVLGPAGVLKYGFRPCGPCTTETVSVIHRTGHTCGDCGTVHHTDEGGPQ